MVVIQRSPGQGVRIGPCTLRVLAVHADEVVVALLDPDKDCAVCGERPAERRSCPVCQAEAVVCPVCVPVWQCPACACSWR
jgi:hypothetical protein